MKEKSNDIINVKGLPIFVKEFKGEKYISLTAIAKSKNPQEPRFLIMNWLRNRGTLEFLGFWESIHNPSFNRIEFDTVKSKAGLNSFTLSPSSWIRLTKAKGITTKAGKYGGGTYAHEDIALEFASWVSPEFKIYLLKEFRKLKYEEQRKKGLLWDVGRELAKINYTLHSDAIKENLIPPIVTLQEARLVYVTEADVLNKALFGLTAKEWLEQNNSKKGNIRDHATILQLIILANLESLNSELIKQNISRESRLLQLNKTAISQLKSLSRSKNKLLQ